MFGRTEAALPMPGWARRRLVARVLVVALVLALPATRTGAAPSARSSFAAEVSILYSPGRPINRFRPDHALGAGIDGGPAGETALLTPANVAAMESAGLKSLTLRLRTELAIDAWHWNPSGKWSDPANAQGYWTSDATSQTPIMASFGYNLPRRGNSIDQANNTGYSRLDDADETSFWKSNPYLDEHFTHEPSARHEQWIVVDLGGSKPISALRLLWGFPFAQSYRVEFAAAIKDISAIALNRPGLWRPFPHGEIAHDSGGDDLRIIAQAPIMARYVRILLQRSSNDGGAQTSDIRDAVGYALREIYVGSIDKTGAFHDEIKHASDHTQTVVFVSSTDPWHRAADLDRGTEQPGFDRVWETGLTHGLPVLIATGLLYDTPDNAAAEIKYLKARHFPLQRIELGEEPDGQYVSPEDYGALYLQFADAVHGIDPALKLGGPSFQEILPDKGPLPLRLGNSAWFKRFAAYLHARRRDADYGFYSFEWYPVDDVCAAPSGKLVEAHRLLGDALHEMQRRGLTHRVPWIISEYGYSAYAARAELGIEGALFDADLVGQFLSLGGDQAFLYGYTPGQPQTDQPCTTGNNLMFAGDDRSEIAYRFATFHAARLLTHVWALPVDRVLELFATEVRTGADADRALVSTYALRRPDGSWSLLLINRDSERASHVRVRFHNTGTSTESPFVGAVDMVQFSKQQYVLAPDGAASYPIKSEPPSHCLLQAAGEVDLPAYSITVLTGKARF